MDENKFISYFKWLLMDYIKSEIEENPDQKENIEKAIHTLGKSYYVEMKELKTEVDIHDLFHCIKDFTILNMNNY